MFKDKVLLITGGTGSFGNAVLRRFLNSDIREVRIFSRDEKKQDDMRHELQNPKVKFYIVEVNKTKRQNSPTLKNSQKFVKWGQWFNTRSNSEKVINFEITDFSMYGDFLPKIDACFL